MKKRSRSSSGDENGTNNKHRRGSRVKHCRSSNVLRRGRSASLRCEWEARRKGQTCVRFVAPKIRMSVTNDVIKTRIAQRHSQTRSCVTSKRSPNPSLVGLQFYTYSSSASQSPSNHQEPLARFLIRSLSLFFLVAWSSRSVATALWAASSSRCSASASSWHRAHKRDEVRSS
jgi:hypothetical protein